MSPKTKVTIRTVIQVVLGLAVITPLLVDQVGGTGRAVARGCGGRVRHRDALHGV